MGEWQATVEVKLMELRARVSELDELQQQQLGVLALKDKELAARPASRAGFWTWLAAAFAVLMTNAWWLGGRSGKASHSSGGHHGPAGKYGAVDPDEVDGKEHKKTTETDYIVPVPTPRHPNNARTPERDTEG